MSFVHSEGISLNFQRGLSLYTLFFLIAHSSVPQYLLMCVYWSIFSCRWYLSKGRYHACFVHHCSARPCPLLGKSQHLVNTVGWGPTNPSHCPAHCRRQRSVVPGAPGYPPLTHMLLIDLWSSLSTPTPYEVSLLLIAHDRGIHTSSPGLSQERQIRSQRPTD